MVTPDPLDALRLDPLDIDPRPRFAAELLRRMQGKETPKPAETARLPSVTPALHYWNPDAALAWLTGVLGLRESWVHRSREGKIQHAELGWRRGLVSINYKRGRYEDYGPTAVLLLVDEAEQVDVVYQRATTAGADTLNPPREDPTRYGFMARDPEGNLWQVSTDTLEALRQAQPTLD